MAWLTMATTVKGRWATITALLVAAFSVIVACAAPSPPKWQSPPPTATPAHLVQTALARTTATAAARPLFPRSPTPLSIPTLEPTPDIERMIDGFLERDFRKVKRDDPRARFVCEKDVFSTVGTGVCLGRGDYPDNLKKVSAWKFTYEASANSTATTEMRTFAYSTTDQFGVLLSCDDRGRCDTEAMPVAEGIRLVEQTAARWNR